MLKEHFTAIWTYPWDLLDEGLDVSLGRIAEAGLKGISLAVSYHAGRLLLPHNPKQRIRYLEDGAIYFRPQGAYFRGLAIQPRISQLAGDTDPLAEICSAAQRHGLEVVAWTVCMHNSHQGERHPDMVMRNAFGDSDFFALCPSHPEVQAYLEALLQALSVYPVRTLQLESYGFMGFRHRYHHEKLNMDLGPLGEYLMGLCFCPACQRIANEQGLDLAAAQGVARGYLEDALEGRVAGPDGVSGEALARELPALLPYLKMRERIEIDLVLRLGRAGIKPLQLLGIRLGMVKELAPHIAEVTESAYYLAPEEVRQATAEARQLVGPDVTLGIGIEACPHLSPDRENLVAKVAAAQEAGADNPYFYNYGLMPLSSLGWLRQALAGGR